jgi:hypothetical protein
MAAQVAFDEIEKKVKEFFKKHKHASFAEREKPNDSGGESRVTCCISERKK